MAKAINLPFTKIFFLKRSPNSGLGDDSVHWLSHSDSAKLFPLKSTNMPGLLLVLELDLSCSLYLQSSLLQISPLLNHFL